MITIEAIKDLLANNPRAVERAMVVLYQRQTSDEQATQQTTHHNGVGFNAFDAHQGSYYAQWILSGRNLTGRHLEKARKMSFRYVKQLQSAAEEKLAAKRLT